MCSLFPLNLPVIFACFQKRNQQYVYELQGLEPDDCYGLSQPKPFYDSMNTLVMSLTQKIFLSVKRESSSPTV